MGLAIVDSVDGRPIFGYPAFGAPNVSREVAECFAERVLGVTDVAGRSDSGLVEQLFQDWLGLGGSPPAARVFGGAGLAGAFEPIDANFEWPHATNADESVWTDLASALLTASLTIRERGATGQSAILSILSDIKVYEILDADLKVVSEGKGATSEHALRSALGEAVERVLAQTVDLDSLCWTTRRHLLRNSIRTPELNQGMSDLYSDDLLLGWLPAQDMTGHSGALPADLAYYPYEPPNGVRAFSVQHTVGCAAAATFSAAAVTALRECIETDAYWISMRTRHVNGRFQNLECAASQSIRSITRRLHAAGICVHAALISFDWPVSIVHVVLETETESLPALAHGLGMGLSHEHAIEKALFEAIQVYSGLEKVALSYWPEITTVGSRHPEPAIAWSSHSFKERVLAPILAAPQISPDAEEPKARNLQDLLRWLTDHGMTPWVASLGHMQHLQAVRVYLEGAISPFSERDEPSVRLMQAVRAVGLRDPYLDPILT